jgi:hypothetical protein
VLVDAGLASAMGTRPALHPWRHRTVTA